MATTVSVELTYDASPDEVYAMLTDPAFREEACRRMRVLRASATAEKTGDATVMTIDQVQPATGLPSFATKLVGDEIRILQEETWIEDRYADVHVSIPGRPGEMEGTAVLEESDGGTVEKVELEVRVRIPLVAGKIEKLVAEMLRKALRAENAAGRDYLSR